MSNDSTNPLAITGFTIRKLFGYLNYSLPKTGADVDAMSKLTVFYGENGTGKTTILKLAYHLLSPRLGKGHRSFLAKTPFELFGITLRDGTRITASREEPIIGSYLLSLEQPTARGKTLSYMVPADEDGDVKQSVLSDKGYLVIMKALLEIAPMFFYLGDDRTLELDYEESDDIRSRPDVYFLEQLLKRSPRVKGDPREEERQQLGAMVEAAVLCVQQWIQYEVNRRTAEGFASVHSVYYDVIKRIASPTSKTSKQQIPKLEHQIQQLSALGKQSQIFQEYGFASKVDSESLIKVIETASRTRKTTIARLLAPYIEGVRAQFDALTDIYGTVHTYFDHLNGFLAPKVVRYNLDEGAAFVSPTGDRLHPRVLSSGERHLVLNCVG